MTGTEEDSWVGDLAAEEPIGLGNLCMAEEAGG